jgi:hypothetical protein
VLLHQQHQRHSHHELVGNRVKKGAKLRHLAQFAGQVTIKPVCDRGQPEYASSHQTVIFKRQVENQHQHRHQRDAAYGEAIGYI